MRPISMAGLALAMLLPAGLAGAEGAAAAGRLTISGEGRVSTAPDMATINLGVVAENAEAAAAVREMSAKMAAVLQRLEAAGIARADVQTSGLSVAPRWPEGARRSDEKPAISGFVASSRVTVRVRDLDRLGGLLDAAVRDGANEFRGLGFGLQDPTPVQDAARRAAVEDAARKAALYAAAAGVELGPILSIDEQGTVRPQMMRAEMAGFAADGGVPIAAGELDVTASVTITYGLLTPE